MIIKILGSGCSKCGKVKNIVDEIIAEENITAEVIKLEDFQDIMAYGVMRTPALVINEDVLFVGKVAKKKDILAEIKSRI